LQFCEQKRSALQEQDKDGDCDDEKANHSEQARTGQPMNTGIV
jgi:hypothetical protein